MRTYPDPSLIISAFVDEPNTKQSRVFLHDIPGGDLIASWWTDTEVTSALGIKARLGTITPNARLTVRAAIRSILNASATIVTPLADDFREASLMMERGSKPLRGGDALHLAIAHRVGATLWTLDRRMAEAGQALGLDARLLG